MTSFAWPAVHPIGELLVFLVGMGHDGADSLGAIHAAGGTAVVEDPESTVVAGMPERALARETGAFVEHSERLAWLVNELAGGSG